MQQQSSIKYTSAATVWGIFTLYGLFRPISELKKHSNFFLPGGDKLIHLILFAVLTYFNLDHGSHFQPSAFLL